MREYRYGSADMVSGSFAKPSLPFSHLLEFAYVPFSLLGKLANEFWILRSLFENIIYHFVALHEVKAHDLEVHPCDLDERDYAASVGESFFRLAFRATLESNPVIFCPRRTIPSRATAATFRHFPVKS
jgi:hypothetical protein